MLFFRGIRALVLVQTVSVTGEDVQSRQHEDTQPEKQDGDSQWQPPKELRQAHLEFPEHSMPGLSKLGVDDDLDGKGARTNHERINEDGSSQPFLRLSVILSLISHGQY